jgi:hypothetical protein
MKQKNVWIDEDDERSIALIQQRYDCDSQSQAVRMAIRIAAHGPLQRIPRPPTPLRAGRRKSRRPLYGLWRESRLAGLDFGAFDAALSAITAEWETGPGIAVPTAARRPKK